MDPGDRVPVAAGPGRPPPPPWRPRPHPAATALALALLLGATVAAGLAFLGRLPLGPGAPTEPGRVFYALAYHYGFAFYDAAFAEVERIEVKVGDTVTLVVVPGHALPEPAFFGYSERSLNGPIGGLPAGDPRIRQKIREDLALGNVEHIVGIAAHPVYITTNVAAALDGEPFRRNGPRTLEEVVRGKDPMLRSVTFTAKRVGAFDVLCVDSGMEGTGTCGWGHKWMVAKGAFVVRP